MEAFHSLFSAKLFSRILEIMCCLDSFDENQSIGSVYFSQQHLYASVRVFYLRTSAHALPRLIMRPMNFLPFADVTFVQPRFNGDSYAVLPLPTDWDYQFNLHMELRANTENGLVFYSGENLAASKNFVSVELLEGYVVFRIRLNGRKIGIQSRYKVPLGDDVKLHVGRSGSTVFVQVAGEARIGTTVQVWPKQRLAIQSRCNQRILYLEASFAHKMRLFT